LAILGDVASYTDTTPTSRYTYYYQVSAVNEFGEGSRSNEIAATPMPPPDCSARSIPGVDSVVLLAIVVAIGAVSVAVALIVWKRRKPGRPPLEGPS